MPAPPWRNRPQPAGENTPSRPAKSPAHTEIGLQRSETDVSSEVTQTGLAAAARPPGRRAAARLEPTQPELDIAADVDDQQRTPGYQDDGICLYIEQWAGELGDDDPQRSLEQAHHLWWNSKLERYQFHNAMKAALHATQERRDAGKLYA